MNGKRCKALKRAVRRLRGSGPAGMTIIEENVQTGLIKYEQSEWRRLKKAYKQERSTA